MAPIAVPDNLPIMLRYGRPSKLAELQAKFDQTNKIYQIQPLSCDTAGKRARKEALEARSFLFSFWPSLHATPIVCILLLHFVAHMDCYCCLQIAPTGLGPMWAFCG